MKGTFFQKPLELILNVEGESWRQGDTISGNLVVKNHGAETFPLKDFGINLSFGSAKKKIFSSLEEHLFKANAEIESGSEAELPFKLNLEKNSPISEKSQGLYVFCGSKEDQSNMLELNVTPCGAIGDLLRVFENLLRFKVKSLKNKKDSIEAIMVVPPSKDFSSVQQLKVLVKMDEDNLDVNFNFKLKEISFEGGVVSTKDKTLKVKKLLTPKDYLIYGDAFNQEKVLNLLQEVIEEVRVKPII